MALYQVQGTSPISWSLLISAGSASEEASQAALRIAGSLGDLRPDQVLRDVRHQLVGSRRLIETSVQDRPDQRSATGTGDEGGCSK